MGVGTCKVMAVAVSAVWLESCLALPRCTSTAKKAHVTHS